MTQARFTDLPTVSNASLTDIICAVQGYMSPSVLGTSVQQTLQQVYSLFIQNLGNATAQSITFNPTTKGIVGTTNADNASTGFVGEVITSNIPQASAVSLTTATPTNVTSINLSAGDWDTFSNVFFIQTMGLERCVSWCSLTSATIPDASITAETSAMTGSPIADTGLANPILRVNISSTTTVYLSCFTDFSAGAVSACGMIYARRVR